MQALLESLFLDLEFTEFTKFQKFSSAPDACLLCDSLLPGLLLDLHRLQGKMAPREASL